MSADALSITPLSEACGARVTGIDLRQPLSPDIKAALRAAFATHCVLCLPAPDLSEGDQARFCALFGKGDSAIMSNEEKGYGKERKRGVMWITNIRENGKPIGSLPDGEMQFHSDGSHRPQPYRATTLYAMKVPSRGGETKFANLYKAYETLPDDVKARIEGREIQYVYAVDAMYREQTDEHNEALSSAVHPIVRTHPETGRRALYLSRLMSRRIVGMDRRESDALLAMLFDHAERPEFVYAHAWAPGDLVIWDNRCLNHARNDFPADEIRLMRRMTVSEPD
jgi:taurine dioxygenase